MFTWGKKKIIMVLTACLLLAALLASGCMEQSKAGYRNNDGRQKLIVGSDIYPPFNFVDEDGAPTGIDVELAKEAGRRMGYDVEFKNINWPDKDELLERGELDCLWGSFSMSGRKELYNWAGPYLVSRQAVAVNKNSSIHKLADLEGKFIAVQTTTKPEEIFTRHKQSNIPHVKKLYSLSNRDLIYAMLGKGYVDAIAMHKSAIEQYNKDVGTNYRILEEPILVTGLGVAFARNDKRGIDKELHKTLQQMHADGTTKKIVAKYMDNPDEYLEVERSGE